MLKAQILYCRPIVLLGIAIDPSHKIPLSLSMDDLIYHYYLPMDIGHLKVWNLHCIFFQAPWIIDVNRPIRTWPAHGAVVFDSYSVRYREGLELVLKQITCTIQGGERVSFYKITCIIQGGQRVIFYKITCTIQGGERVSFYRVTCTTKGGQRAIQSDITIDFYG